MPDSDNVTTETVIVTDTGTTTTSVENEVIACGGTTDWVNWPDDVSDAGDTGLPVYEARFSYPPELENHCPFYGNTVWSVGAIIDPTCTWHDEAVSSLHVWLDFEPGVLSSYATLEDFVNENAKILGLVDSTLIYGTVDGYESVIATDFIPSSTMRSKSASVWIAP